MIRIIIEPREPSGTRTPDQLIKELEDNQTTQEDGKADNGEDSEGATLGSEHEELAQEQENLTGTCF